MTALMDQPGGTKLQAPIFVPMVVEISARGDRTYDSVSAGLAIYDTMQFVTSEISSLCIGQALSISALLLAGGTNGKRYCLPHTRIMLHQPLGDFEGPATDIDIHAREILQVRRQLDGILARHTAQSLQRIRKDTERDYFMDPRDAVEYGLIDDILQRRDSLPNN